MDAAMLEAGRALSPPKISNEPEPASPIVGVPKFRADNTFASFDVGRSPKMAGAKARCALVATGEAWCAFLYGPPGTGKTHLAVAVLNASSTRGVFWKVPAFLSFLRGHLRQEMSDDPPAFALETLITNYTGGLVVFDDLGTENPTDWANEQLYRILDGRYERRAPTVITSNVASARIDQRIWSRYREGLVVCEGEDVRG